MRGIGLAVKAAIVLGMAMALAGPSAALAQAPLTQAEAAAILGDKVAEPRISSTRGLAQGRKFFYSTDTPAAKHGGEGTLRVIVYNDKTMKGYDGALSTPGQVFNHMVRAKMIAAKRSGKTMIERVSGIGDLAYWEASSHTLHFRAHRAYVLVQVKDLKKFKAGNRAELDQELATHRKQLAEKAAKLIIPRLKSL